MYLKSLRSDLGRVLFNICNILENSLEANLQLIFFVFLDLQVGLVIGKVKSPSLKLDVVLL
jgi:hypothetical protein